MYAFGIALACVMRAFGIALASLCHAFTTFGLTIVPPFLLLAALEQSA
jgi:hypothetical protein